MVSLTPVDLQQRLLADRFRMLTGSKRQRSLRETVGWSYELLTDEERAVLRHASVFSGGFGLDAITDVVGAGDTFDVLDRLDSLVRKSLVTTSHATGQVRYGLLETIRQFAEDELSTLGTLEQVRDRHVIGDQGFQILPLLVRGAGQPQDLGVARIWRGAAKDPRRDRTSTKLLVNQSQSDVAHAQAAGCLGEVGCPEPFSLHPRLELFEHIARQAAMRDRL